VKYVFPVAVLFALVATICIPDSALSSSLVVSSDQIPDSKSSKKPEAVISQEKAEDDVTEEDLDFSDEEEEALVLVPDPIGGWNRAMYRFNDKLYFWFLKPIAIGYRTVIPSIVRTGIKNFLYNVTVPVRFVNSLLQGKWKKAEAEFSRFMICTTYGVLGFGNPIKNYPDLNPGAEDLGQTFGAWGIENGFYIVWPFLGPSTFRDSVGLVGDFFLDPTFIVNRLDVTIAVWSVDLVNKTSFRIGDYEAIKEAAIDPYISIRDAYIQNRIKRIEE
jgi:phospholipid-binding lipoprotein MlaA